MKPLLILVWDGDQERRQSLVALLRGANHETVVAADPEAAAEAIGSGRFDALLLDLSLEQLDGAALADVVAAAGWAAPESLENAERRHLARVLHHTSGNKRKAAHLLGISRSTLLNKVRKYGLG
jgi:DNA-binding NtrC family response regulator